MRIGNKTFQCGTHIMAIINLTPDSFFKESRTAVEDLIPRVQKAIDNGADVIDIGGQSTRPNHIPISQSEEWQRLERPIDLIKSHFDIPLSVDT